MLKRIAIKLVFVFLLILSGLSKAEAQDPEFSQFYANPIYLNPALAGSHCPRVHTNARNQWAGIDGGPYRTFGLTFDQQSFLLHGGIGLMVINDITGGNTLNTLTFSGVYNYTQNLSKSWQIRAGFQLDYRQRSLDISNLSFGDMIDERMGFIYNTAEPLQNGTIQNFDAAAGLIVSSDVFFIGGAVHHLLEPIESFYANQDQSSKVPMKITGHFGAKIKQGNSNYSEYDDFLSPNVIYRQQASFKHLNLGFYMARGPLVTGVWYRGFLFADNESNDALILLAGLRAGSFKVGYSYDVTISKLGLPSGGSHELSASFHFNCKPPTRKFKPIACPEF